MGRVEEILEVALIVSETAEHSPTVLGRSSAGELHDPESLREMAHRELELAAVDIGCLAFGCPTNGPDQFPGRHGSRDFDSLNGRRNT